MKKHFIFIILILLLSIIITSKLNFKEKYVNNAIWLVDVDHHYYGRKSYTKLK